MAEKKAWTLEEDRLLKYVFENSKLTKWSHIARKLQEEYGVKGRNGKQCKERYSTHIDTSYPREEWSYQDEQRMVQFHNELGNKWAIIGGKLGGRSDNCVKNHFYALLRKSLRKINKVIQLQFRKEFKQFSPSVLYRIVEVSEEKFKLVPNYQPNFSQLSLHLKNDLIEFSYDDGIGTEEDIDAEAVRAFIDRIMEFTVLYKRKPKKERKGSGQAQDLLTPTRYHQLEKEESEGNSFLVSSDTSNIEDISDDEISRLNIEEKRRKSSAGSAKDSLSPNKPIRSRARSQCNLNSRYSYSYSETPNYEMENFKVQINIEEQLKGDISNILGEEGIMAGMQMLKQEDDPPESNMLGKSPSKYNRSENLLQPEEYHYFESGIQMRILPEIELDEHSSHEQDMF